ncbi:MAG: radical SAM protein [bacterium]|nr:radical SAM protein [bacterium]
MIAVRASQMMGKWPFFKKGFDTAIRDIRVNYLGRFIPWTPTALNLLANDVCNSKCRMCNVWKQKKDTQFTPRELERILIDPLFKKLEYIGVSGGEPTLRDDLPDIFRVIARKTPTLRGTGIITNAIRKDPVIPRIEKSAGICRKEGIRFGVMVSLDGIGPIHDTVRGHKGNYESAAETIRYFRDKTDIPVTIGCTVTKDNVWHVDEVLDFCKREGVIGRFRVAEFIHRLYNHDQTAVIRNFSQEEKYHLGLFFVKLERLEKKGSPRKRTYRNIRKMLLEDAERSTRCHWQTTAVTLDCRGRLLYCAPRSPILGSCLKKSARFLYRRNISKRRKILKENCASCIHDYGSTETFREWLEETREEYWREQFSVDRAAALTKSAGKTVNKDLKPVRPPRKFLVIGWYGTETAGDKAILAQIIFQLQERYPHCRITLASIHPYYSQWTLRELGLKNIDIIPTFSSRLFPQIKKSDEIIMGGGPLMHVAALGAVAAAFYRAQTLGKKTRIAGCGIGPLHRHEKFEHAVQRILELSDQIELRDSDSIRWAQERTGRKDITLSGDYAAAFVKRWKEQYPVHNKKPFLNLYLREWTPEYKGTLSNDQFNEMKARFERKLAAVIRKICTQQDLEVRLLPMHHFCIGRDDRDFNREFARTHLGDLELFSESRPLPLHDLLSSMQEAALSICMRFHSVLFADTLGVPFIAVDYTRGGKISGYLRDRDKCHRMYTIDDIVEDKEIRLP